jgi:hypothetical protein
VISPIFDQLRAAHRRGRYRPPPPRGHRNRVRRPDRRTPAPHALRTLRRQLRVGAVRRDCAQPAARRRDTGRRPPRGSERCDTATTDRHRPSQTGPTRAQTRPAPTSPLALGNGMASAVATRQRPRPTSTHLIPTPPLSTRGRHQWKSWTDQQLPYASETNRDQQM